MKKNYRRILQTLICAAFCACAAPRAGAEDIDLFVSSATNAATNPNVLIVLDNSANWSAANQGWPGGVKQGQSELRSLRTLVNELSDNVNVGLMMLTQGTGGNANGGYIRFDIRQMTAANKAALRELIGDNTCVNGANSLNGTPNCIYNNFDSSTEKIGSSGTDYSRALFEVFKYFGGYTSPANANSAMSPAQNPESRDHFPCPAG